MRSLRRAAGQSRARRLGATSSSGPKAVCGGRVQTSDAMFASNGASSAAAGAFQQLGESVRSERARAARDVDESVIGARSVLPRSALALAAAAAIEPARTMSSST
jgi:hypothetical protein